MSNFTALLNAVSCPLIIHHNDNIRFANSAAETLTGYDSAALRTLPFTQLIHPDYQSLLTAGKGEIKLLSAQKQPVWVEFSTESIEYNGQQSMLVTLIDISARKQGEMMPDARLFHEVLSSTFDMIVVYDRDDRFLYANATALQTQGLTLGEIVGKTWRELGFPEKYGLVREQLRAKVLSDGEAVTTVLPFPTLEGERVYEEFLQPIYDPNGQVIAIVMTGRDITDRQKMEETLLYNQRFIERIANTVPDVIHVYDLQEQRSVYSNREVMQMLGYTSEALQAMGSSLVDTLVHPDDLAKPKEDIHRLLEAKDGDIIESVFRWRHANGEWRWIYNRTTVFTRSPDGTPKQILGVSQDISEQKRAEDALHRSEKLYRTLTHSFPNGAVIVFDHELRYLLVDGQELEHMGYVREAMEGRTIWETLPLEVAQQVEPVYRAALAGEAQINTIVGPNNIYLLNTLPLLDENGEIYAGMGIAINITEQKRAEEALRRSEERLQYLLTNAPVAIFSAQPYNDFAVKFVSDNVLSLTGFTPHELISDPTLWMSHIHPEDVDWVKERLSETLLTGENSYEYRFLCKDGTYKWTHEEVRLIRDLQGKPTEIVGYWQDISQRKQMESALLLQERLQVALQKEKELGDLKSKMMVRISHEFRTPLSIITMSSELLERYYDNLTPEKREQHFQRIKNGVIQVASLLDDTAMAVKGLSDYLDFTPVSFDLARLCHDIAEEARGSLAANHSLELKLPSAPLPITADRDLVRRIVLNLLSNAVKFSPTGKTIQLEAASESGACLLHIADEGIGIAPDDQERLFEPFFRGSNVGETQGLGLGLCIVQNAVELHRGHIIVHSEPDQGARFTVHLPIHP
jgi:PAS domain S-box-containing protein